MPPLGSATLLLIPTELERARIQDRGALAPGLAQVECCGFGPVAAAARTAALCALLRPARVVLAGIAGAYDTEQHPVGSAVEFAAVAIEGVGVGRGAGFLPPSELGFPQWPGTESPERSGGSGARGIDPIYDRLPLALPRSGTWGQRAAPLLLTTCAASANAAEAAERRARFPEAAAEDMEAFAVAAACALAGTPLRVVRGVSNRAGERDPARWRIPAALAAARELALEILASPAEW
jgi:futalosine hydrolase